MDIRKIKKLIDLLNENDIAEIKIREDKESLHIISNKQNRNIAPNIQQPTPKMVITEEIISEETKTVESTKADTNTENAIKSPMVGTVYMSPSPGAKNFVEIGQKVNAGDTLCLIEAMKMFNKIEADHAGTVTAKLAEDAQPVEFGQPLFVIE